MQIYDELYQAYNFFNEKLFENKLPKCLITLQRKKQTLGYVSYKRFVNKEGEIIDELAMNPVYFGVRTIKETLSTLVHEMVHILQAVEGTAGRGGYHNKNWGDNMEKIGLMPSNTGREGGKRTGDQMTHYIIKGGLYELACEELMTEEFRLSWADRFPPVKEALISTLRGDDEELENEDVILTSGFSLKDLVSDEPKQESTRVKYTCPACHQNAYGGKHIKLICGIDKVEMVVNEKPTYKKYEPFGDQE